MKMIRTVVVLICVSVVSLFAVFYKRPEKETKIEEDFSAEEESGTDFQIYEETETSLVTVKLETETSTNPEEIYVYITGAVKFPGVYKLERGQRIFELLNLSGGLLEDADERSINQASLLFDGEQVTVPFKGEENVQVFSGNPKETVLSDESEEVLININTADKQALMNLPSIGEKKADAILEYRETNGPFKTESDLMKVSGIGEALYNKLKSRIKI